MKLMIEIPEEVLKPRRYTDFFGCGSTMLTAMLDSGTPLDAVLDEIRAEIDSAEIPKNRMSFFRDGINCALQIIDKYKAENITRTKRGIIK